MENIKQDTYQYTVRSHRNPNSGARSIRRAWLACAAIFDGIRGIFRHYLPLQSTFKLQQAKPSRSQRFAIGVRCLPIMTTFTIMLVCIAVHCYKLLVLRHPEFEEKAQSHCQSIQSMKGARGCIYTVDNKLLAGNYFQKDIYIEPKKIPAKYQDTAVKAIAKATHRPESEIWRMFFDVIYKNQDIALSRGTDRRTAKRIEAHGYPHTRIIRNSHIRNKKDRKQISCTSYSVVFTLPFKQQLAEYMPTILQIGSDLGMDEKAVLDAVNGRHGLARIKQVKVQAGIDFTDGVELEKCLRGIQGLGKGAYQVDTKVKRIHPQGSLAAPLVGVTCESDGQGLSGVEELFDAQLQPTSGSNVFLKDGRGKRLPMTENIRTILPMNGNDLFLTINSGIQNIAEEELAAAIPDVKPDRAYAVMMNPRTGAIMALTQYPTFDPNKRDEVEDPAGFGFLPLTETFEPGSIMKGISLSCGISEGIFDLNTHFFCENGYWPSAKLHDTHRNENLSITEIIMHSSNIGTAKAAIDLGPYKLFRGLAGFGFGKKTHLGFFPAGEKPIYFKKEASGIFRPLERWDKLSITRFPIGQGISVTPFQMIQAYSAIANNGIMMQPYIIDRMLTQDGTMTTSIPRVKGRPISANAARQMKEALKTVPTKEGTARRAAIDGYTVAGKTGTSEIWDSEKHRYDTQRVVASFIGFAPADSPEFVLLVTFVNPKPKRHGGTIAGPVFSKIGARTLEYLQIPREDQEDVAAQKQTRENQQESAKKR
ncbi:MAG: penicillin-binding protein 2 [Victivallales bacterium]|nr:penicillin-binding protein 2 [Victivallales bacterium]